VVTNPNNACEVVTCRSGLCVAVKSDCVRCDRVRGCLDRDDSEEKDVEEKEDKVSVGEQRNRNRGDEDEEEENAQVSEQRHHRRDNDRSFVIGSWVVIGIIGLLLSGVGIYMIWNMTNKKKGSSS